MLTKAVCLKHADKVHVL